MVRILVLVALVMAVAWIYHEFASARRRRASNATHDIRGHTILPRHQRVDDATLAKRLLTLRAALDAETLTLDEAVESLVRTCGVEPADARDLLAS